MTTKRQSTTAFLHFPTSRREAPWETTQLGTWLNVARQINQKTPSEKTRKGKCRDGGCQQRAYAHRPTATGPTAGSHVRPVDRPISFDFPISAREVPAETAQLAMCQNLPACIEPK